MNRRWHIALVGLFFTLLWLPLPGALSGPPGAGSDENRALAPLPALDEMARSPQEFPRKFEAWYNDHFGFRQFLVGQYHRVHFGWLGIADPRKVVKGEEGWLYLGRHALIDEARGLNPLSPEEVAAWVDALESIRRWQEERGGVFVLALVPDKHRLFPEHLPAWFRPSEKRRKEQLLASLAATKMDVLDLTGALRAAKEASDYPIWLKTDTHWNGVGAYYGYRAILDWMRERIPGIAARPAGAFALTEAPSDAGLWHNTGNLAAQLGVRDLVPETWLGLLPRPARAAPAVDYPPPSRPVSGVNVPYATALDDADAPAALVIGGSFRWALVPLLSEHFRRVLYTDFRYCFFDPALAAGESPDVILFVMTEQQLLWFPRPPAKDTW